MVLSVHFVNAQQNGAVDFLQDQSSEKLKFQLYPNPLTGDLLHIVSGSMEIKNVMILNILGEVVFQTSTYEDHVSPSNLTAGIYIVKIKQGGRQGLSRLVVP
jgi:hypothetical protein